MCCAIGTADDGWYGFIGCSEGCSVDKVGLWSSGDSQMFYYEYWIWIKLVVVTLLMSLPHQVLSWIIYVLSFCLSGVEAFWNVGLRWCVSYSLYLFLLRVGLLNFSHCEEVLVLMVFLAFLLVVVKSIVRFHLKIA